MPQLDRYVLLGQAFWVVFSIMFLVIYFETFIFPFLNFTLGLRRFSISRREISLTPKLNKFAKKSEEKINSMSKKQFSFYEKEIANARSNIFVNDTTKLIAYFLGNKTIKLKINYYTVNNRKYNRKCFFLLLKILFYFFTCCS